jgi:hypothetical protein
MQQKKEVQESQLQNQASFSQIDGFASGGNGSDHGSLMNNMNLLDNPTRSLSPFVLKADNSSFIGGLN